MSDTTLIHRLRERRMCITLPGDKFRVSGHPDPDCKKPPTLSNSRPRRSRRRTRRSRNSSDGCTQGLSRSRR